MASEKAIALVLRVIDFSETSCVVTLFTREFGKLTGLAKGGRRLKGPFESALDLLALVRLVFLRKSSDAFDLLTEAKLKRRFRGHDRDLSAYYAGYYVAELLIELTDDYDPHPALFDLAEQTLAGLSSGGPAPLLIFRYELAALDILGFLPVLEICAECGANVPLTGRVAFGAIQGGVLCSRCRPGKPHVISVSAWSVTRSRGWRVATETPGGVWRSTRGPRRSCAASSIDTSVIWSAISSSCTNTWAESANTNSKLVDGLDGPRVVAEFLDGTVTEEQE